MNANNDTNNMMIRFTALAGIDADKCPSTHRLCKVMYKEEKIDGVKTGKKRASLGAFIPSLSLGAIVACDDKTVAQWIDAQVLGVQDKIIRARLDVQGCNDVVMLPTVDDVIVAIREDMQKERTRSAGLSGEAIKAWFIDGGMRGALVDAFATKLGAGKDDMRVQKVVTAYGDNMALLAGKAQMPDAVLENLVKAMDVLSVHAPDALEDDMYMRVLERIEAKGKKVEVDLMAL